MSFTNINGHLGRAGLGSAGCRQLSAIEKIPLET
jgi:hypothetical protein